MTMKTVGVIGSAGGYHGSVGGGGGGWPGGGGGGGGSPPPKPAPIISEKRLADMETVIRTDDATMHLTNAEFREFVRCFRLVQSAEFRAANPERFLTPEKAKELAAYILHWLKVRNGAELADAFDDMTVRDAENMRGELEMILEHGGKPKNWSGPT